MGVPAPVPQWPLFWKLSHLQLLWGSRSFHPTPLVSPAVSPESLVTGLILALIQALGWPGLASHADCCLLPRCVQASRGWHWAHRDEGHITGEENGPLYPSDRPIWHPRPLLASSSLGLPSCLPGPALLP